MKESWRHKWKVVRKWNVIVWKGILFLFFCLLAPLDSASVPLGICLTKKLAIVICFCLRFKLFLSDTWHYHWKCLCCGLPLLYRGDIVPRNFAPHPILHKFHGVTDSGYFPLDHSSTNTVDADTPSLSLPNVDGLRVRNSRHSTSSETLCVRKICS